MPQYETCLVRIKEKVGEKRSTVYIHRCANCLLKNTSNKHNIYIVNQFQRTFWQNQSGFFFLQNKICPFQRQCICICVVSFFGNTVELIPLIYLLALSAKQLCRVQKSNAIMTLPERDLDCVHSTKAYRVLQNPHLIHTTLEQVVSQ